MGAEWANAFYWSPQWRKCRKDFISYRRGLCERCLSKGLIVPGVHVHHKERLTPENINRPEVTLNWSNLELLCEKCHEDAHSARHTKTRMVVNKDGTVEGREVDTR